MSQVSFSFVFLPIVQVLYLANGLLVLPLTIEYSSTFRVLWSLKMTLHLHVDSFVNSRTSSVVFRSRRPILCDLPDNLRLSTGIEDNYGESEVYRGGFVCMCMCVVLSRIYLFLCDMLQIQMSPYDLYHKYKMTRFVHHQCGVQ